MNNSQLLNNQHGQFKNLNDIVETSTAIDSVDNADKRSIQIAKLKAEARKTVRSNAWKFLSKNKDLLHRDTIITNPLAQFTNKKYKSVSDVPSLVELYDTLKQKTKAKTNILSKRKMSFMEQSKNNSMANIIQKQMSATQAKLERLQQNALIQNHSDKKIDELIEITRTEPAQRSIDSCKILLKWLMDNCRKDSIIYTFISSCDEKDGIEFCRGLQYQIFTQNEAIIRQGALGYAYYITLTGECDIFVNKLLLNNEIADPNRKNCRQGAGQFIATIKQGADFGEYALLSNAKRSASVVAKSLSVECLVCLQQHFKKSLGKHTQKETTKMVNNMKKTYLFKGAAKSYLRMLFNRFHRVTIESDTLLQQQNHSVETIFLLTKGKCREYIEIKDNGKTRKECICEFKEGDVVIGGYHGLLNKKPLSSIITCSLCQCLTIDKDQFITSINREMKNKLINVGTKKEIFVKQCIAKFPNVVKNISILFSKGKSEEKQMFDWKDKYERHGKWGQIEKQSFDTMSSINLQETIKKNIQQAQQEQAIQEITDPIELERGTRHGITHNNARLTILPKTPQDITISVPSIEKFAKKLSPKRKCRFTAKSPVIGGLFDYEGVDYRQSMTSDKNRQKRSELKRPHTTQMAQSLPIEGEPENPFDFIDIEKDDQLPTRYMNDLMSSNFQSLSNLDVEDKNVYDQMMKALKSRYIQRKSRKKKNKSSKKKKSKKVRTRKRYKTKRSIPTMNYSVTMRQLPVLKTKTKRKITTPKAFGRSLPKKTARTNDSRTQIKVTKDKYGRNNYQINFGKYKNINLEITEWVKFNDVYRDFVQLQWRHKYHIMDQVEDARSRLSRTGSSPDLLMKYYAKNNPQLLQEYIKYFSKPTL